ncbi:MAG: hypothetical protein Q8P05_00500 [Candidatus Diapherotrites archaeon]|nr:hypothetical protein [Candidatus Diapherotrites archaeon]
MAIRMNKGFVLSFATFVLALFLLLFAQLMATHFFGLQVDRSEGWTLLRPLRVAQDISLDFNSLLDQHLRIDQNDTHASLFMNGFIPSPLDLNGNLQAYSSRLTTFGEDQNLLISLGLTQTLTDGNLTGRTDTGLVWKQSLDTNTLILLASNERTHPLILDINAIADRNAGTYTPLSVGEEGDADVRVYLHYRDTNASQTVTEIYDLDYDLSYTASWTYSPPMGGNDTFSIRFLSGEGEGTYQMILANPSVAKVKYAVRWDMLNDINGTRGGYDLNLTIRGIDANVDTNTIWVAG